MIGLPSGLERVRWNESASSPQPASTPRMRAPRAVAASRLSSTSAPAPSAITKPSRFFENGRTAMCGGSFCVDRFSNRVVLFMNASFTVPVGPFRCLAMMTSAMLSGWKSGSLMR